MYPSYIKHKELKESQRLSATAVTLSTISAVISITSVIVGYWALQKSLKEDQQSKYR